MQILDPTKLRSMKLKTEKTGLITLRSQLSYFEVVLLLVVIVVNIVVLVLMFEAVHIRCSYGQLKLIGAF